MRTCHAPSLICVEIQAGLFMKKTTGRERCQVTLAGIWTLGWGVFSVEAANDQERLWLGNNSTEMSFFSLDTPNIFKNWTYKTGILKVECVCLYVSVFTKKTKRPSVYKHTKTTPACQKCVHDKKEEIRWLKWGGEVGGLACYILK